jgi:hypothetical protein
VYNLSAVALYSDYGVLEVLQNSSTETGTSTPAEVFRSHFSCIFFPFRCSSRPWWNRDFLPPAHSDSSGISNEIIRILDLLFWLSLFVLS